MAKKYTNRKKTETVSRFNKPLWFGVGGIVLLVAGLGAALWYDTISEPIYNPNIIFEISDGRNHVQPGTPIEYSNHPPSSGDHYSSSLAWGIYDEPIDEGYWLHSMEHGGVVVLYSCEEDCAEVRSELEAFYNNAPFNRCNEARLIVMPYEGDMESKITALAWQQRLNLDEFDDRQLTDFYRVYEEMGPEALPCGVNGDFRM